MRVRKAEDTDLGGITALLERCYPILMSTAYPEDILTATLPVMTKANPQLVASGRFFVVEDENTIIGCGGWSFETPGTGVIIEGVAHIRHFAVDPEHSRKGIGQAIFQRCAKAAKKADAKKFQAFSSLNAEPFYKNMGLERRDQFSVLMGNGTEFPVIFMEGSLVDQ